MMTAGVSTVLNVAEMSKYYDIYHFNSSVNSLTPHFEKCFMLNKLATGH